MRNVQASDLFTLMGILRKTKAKERLLNIKVPRDEEGNMTITEEEWGIMMILEVLEGAPDAKSDIFKFLADIAGVKQKEMEQDEFELLPKVIDHLMNQEKFVNFLSNAFNRVN